MAFGTAWAIRGKFGHEQGAAWAGAIGAISVVLVAKRADWYNKVFKIALAAAVGWGLSGMISYGVVVGYGRGTDFINVYYGLMMLFVIGVLYGFLGGGLFALALADSKEFKVILGFPHIAEMVAFALLTYGFLINQLEWLMTPPRSELWAACLGASIALAWYILRHKQQTCIKGGGMVGTGRRHWIFLRKFFAGHWSRFIIALQLLEYHGIFNRFFWWIGNGLWNTHLIMAFQRPRYHKTQQPRTNAISCGFYSICRLGSIFRY